MSTIIKDEAAKQKALTLCRGHYQRAIIEGRANLSGSDLHGKAKEYGRHYKWSRENLLARLVANGVPVSERRGAHNKRILVIG